MSRPEEPPDGLSIDEFLGDEPTRDPAAWRRLWEQDLAFPLRSHRGTVGRLLVAFKRLLRPLVRAPQSDLWDRQRTFNVVLLGLLEEQRRLREQAESDLGARLDALDGQVEDLRRTDRDLLRDLRQVRDDLQRDVQLNEGRISDLELWRRDGLDAVMRHVDSLFAVVDQKFDRYRDDSRRMWARLGGLLAVAEEAEPAGPPELAAAWSERRYVELEERFRGAEAEIAERAAAYLPYLERGGAVLDLGCGRGELLALLGERGIAARGVDASEEMVRRCREQGLEAAAGDLVETLAAAPEGSLGGVVSLHVIEHLPATLLPRLAALAYRALRPGGVLILETPNPLSLVVAARNFWLDPTHDRPIHPATLRFNLEQAGFDPVERLELRPFAAEDRLPELDLAELDPELRPLAEKLNRLRDQLDELLFGFQDYALVATKPAG